MMIVFSCSQTLREAEIVNNGLIHTKDPIGIPVGICHGPISNKIPNIGIPNGFVVQEITAN